MSPDSRTLNGRLSAPRSAWRSAPDLAVHLVARGVGLLPWRAALLIGSSLGRVGRLLVRRKSRRAAENLRRAGRDRPWRRCGEAWRHLGKTVLEILWLSEQPCERARDIITVRGQDELRRAALEGRGVLLVSAHLGNWELVALAAAGAGAPVAVVANPLRFPELERRIVEFRRRGGIRTLVRGTPGASVAAVRWLPRGGVLGCMMDRLSGGPRLKVPFLGRATNVPLGPAILACRARSAVVIGTATRRGDNTTEVTFRRLPTDEIREPGKLGAAIGEALEAEVRTRPEQWYSIHRRQPRWRRSVSPDLSSPG